jgi:hypothetical protein
MQFAKTAPKCRNILEPTESHPQHEDFSGIGNTAHSLHTLPKQVTNKVHKIEHFFTNNILSRTQTDRCSSNRSKRHHPTVRKVCIPAIPHWLLFTFFRDPKWNSVIDHLSPITWGGGGGVWRKHAYSFCWQQEVETHLINNKNGKIYAKLVAGTENDKHDNH